MYSLANASYYGGKVLEAYARRELERIAPPELLAKGDDLTTADLAAGIEARARRLVEMEAGAKRRTATGAADRRRLERRAAPARVAD